MATQPIDITTIRFEAKDAEIFRIPDIKTRLDTLQNYFFPRLEVLLRDTVDIIQEVYGVNPYERMTVTARPRHRREARRYFDTGIVYMGLTGQRRADRPLIVQHRDGRPFSYPPSRLTYIVYPEGELQVMFHPFTREVDARFQASVAALLHDHWTVLAPLLAVYYVAPTCAGDGVFVELPEAFGPSAVTKATPFSRLAMATSPHHFPLDAHMFLWLQGAFLVLYPLLEACTALAAGESHRLMERIDAFKQWYLQSILEKKAEAEAEPITPGPSESVLPELDSYTLIRAGLWWAVLARDQWTCCSCGRSARQDGVLLEVDHILPRSRGGSNAMDNLQTLCRKCNQGKSHRDSTDLRRDAAEHVKGDGRLHS
jgi:HNH endonuclease